MTTSIPTLLDGDGSTTVESSSAKAACLNNVFYTCFNYNYSPLTDAAQDLDFPYGSLCPSHCHAHAASLYRGVSPRTVGWTGSTGSDGISPKMLKSTSLSIAPSLCRLFNLSISTGTFPTSWKLGRITPILKGTNKSLPSGYIQTNICPPSCKRTH